MHGIDSAGLLPQSEQVLRLYAPLAVPCAARRPARVDRVLERAVRVEPLGLDRGVEAVDVEDGDQVGPGPLHDRAQVRVAALVALDQLERELHRRLVRRPLAGVVRADHHVLGPAVGRRRDVLGDLHADDVAALERLERQREQAHEPGVRRGQRLELLLDLRQRAVARPAARDADGRGCAGGLAAARLALDPPVHAVTLEHVADADREREARGAQLALVGGRVQQHVLVVRRRVVGGVQPEPGKPRLVVGAVERHPDEPEVSRRRPAARDPTSPTGSGSSPCSRRPCGGRPGASPAARG